MKFVLSSFIYISLFFTPALSQKETPLNLIIDQWHKDAASANFTSYFNVMGDHFVFLGTDPKERWEKETFYSFCKPYFDKGKAWDFKPSKRNWVFSSDGNTAWFDESLETWMRECRGSGILEKQNNTWKLVYYNLTVLIENEKVSEFIKLRDLK